MTLVWVVDVFWYSFSRLSPTAKRFKPPFEAIIAPEHSED